LIFEGKFNNTTIYFRDIKIEKGEDANVLDAAAKVTK
jgi:hypothetical protein